MKTLSDPLIEQSKEFYDNPYPLLKVLRDQEPVFWSEKGQYWLITRYADAHSVLSDLEFEKGVRKFKATDALAKVFPKLKEMLQHRGANMLNANPPVHTRMRTLVNKAFTPTMIKTMRPHIEAITNQLLDAVQARGKMDLIEDFAYPLPAIVIAEMLGIPPHDRDHFKSWSRTLTSLLNPRPDVNLIDIGKVAVAHNQLETYLRPLIDERRITRKDDLISALVIAEEEGSKLTEVELLSNIILLLVAGHETTTNLIGNGALALLQHPNQLALLKENPSLITSAVAECLRYDSPVQLVRRVAAENLSIGDKHIQEEQPVYLSIGAANRDPAQFPSPDEFDIQRSPNKHLAFGHGIHHCLGSALAETEGDIALSTLFRRMPNLTFEPRKLEHKQPFALRGLKELWVTF